MPRNVIFLLGAIMAASLLLHLWLANELNVVEDESAYIMDAWQISPHVLPFREFGATKGPVFLFMLKGWQLLTGQSLIADRLLNSLLHVISIPLLYLFARALTRQHLAAILAAAFWGLTPAAVSLTTNVIHAPLELVWILAAFALIANRSRHRTTIPITALLFFLAVLTRATAATFLPLTLLLIYWQTKSWRALATFCLTGAVLLAATVAIVYPLYGWPKTAFFFNADALLIAQDQQAVYQKQTPSDLTMLFRALTPMWYEGLPVILLALALPFLALRAVTWPLRAALAVLALLAARALASPLFADIQKYFDTQLAPHVSAAHVALIGIGLFAATALLLPLRPAISRRRLFTLAILALWVASFIGFYRFWGRDPTPFYILETIPALSVGAAMSLTLIARRNRPLGLATGILAFALLGTAYLAIPYRQYRGTVYLEAAYAAGAAVTEHVPEGEPVFTAQPSYAYLGKRPLYRGLTHPGWYLYEDAGIVPTSIRRVFFPDLDVLLHDVEKNIDWIVTDWRTNDVYFSDRTQASRAFQTLLKEQYQPIVEIPNDISQPIILYRRQ